MHTCPQLPPACHAWPPAHPPASTPTCPPAGPACLPHAAALGLGAARVYAVDSVPERLALAERFGAVAVNREEKDAAAQVVRCGLHCCWHGLFAAGCLARPSRCVVLLLCVIHLPALLHAPAGRPPGGAGLMLGWRWWAAPQPCVLPTTWCAQAAPSPLLAATQVGALQTPQAAMQLAGATVFRRSPLAAAALHLLIAA
jgi:hypothetical protein